MDMFAGLAFPTLRLVQVVFWPGQPQSGATCEQQLLGLSGTRGLEAAKPPLDLIRTRINGLLWWVAAPEQDSFVQYFVDAGIAWSGIGARTNDSAGFGLGWTKLSATATGAAAGTAAAPGQRLPVRTSETVLELTYQATLTPWCIVQPTAQYIFNPGGGVLNPNGSGRPVASAFVLSLRTTVTF